MPTETEMLDFLAKLAGKGRMVLAPESAPLIKGLMNDGLVEKWGIPDMMIYQPTVKGRALIAEKSATDSDENDDQV